MEVHVFRILAPDDSDSGNALKVLQNGVKTPLPKPGETVGSVYGSKLELSVHSERWTLDKDGLSRAETDEKTVDSVQEVSSPAILLPLGESAEIHIGEQGAQYFEREEDGVYALRTVDGFVGYTFECTLSRSAAMEGTLSMEISSTLRETGDREPVPGLSLDVGKPTIRETKFETNIELKPNDWLGSVSRNDDGSILLTLVTARESGS